MVRARQEPQVARKLGRYALYDEIASGGIGTVCLARFRAEAGFSRILAVKRLHPHHAKDALFVTMFRDEARLAARVQHPNVIAVLDVVSDANELFLVMEYVAGESLGKLLRRLREQGARVDPAIATSIMMGVLDGLHAAHLATNEQGVPLNIVHRDVSPQNVLVGVDGVARVVDFGIAKAAERHQDTTETGQVKGKLVYMSPEQFAGAKDVDRRSDLWSAAAVLWEMLVGRQLFLETTDALRYHSGRDALTRPSAMGAPDVLDTVVMRGLAQDPDDRFQTAREMLIALEQAVVPASPRHVAEWVQKNAREALAARAASVERIERDASRASAMTAAAAVAGNAEATVPEVDRRESVRSATGVNVTRRDVTGRSRRGLGMWGTLLLLAGGLAGAALHPAVRAKLRSEPSAKWSVVTRTSTTASSRIALPIPSVGASTASEAASLGDVVPRPVSSPANADAAPVASAKRAGPKPPLRAVKSRTAPSTPAVSAPGSSASDPLDLRSRQ